MKSPPDLARALLEKAEHDLVAAEAAAALETARQVHALARREIDAGGGSARIKR